MTRQAMNYLLGQLEELGYVERRVDPNDVRSRTVHLTPRGTSTIGVIRDAVTELERDWEAQLGPEHWRQLKRAARRAQRSGGRRARFVMRMLIQSGDGGNRTRVRNRVTVTSTSVSGALISPSRRLAGGVHEGQLPEMSPVRRERTSPGDPAF